MIDLDNGPDVSSRRTQLMKRLVELADKFGLEIELVYYPPYHSKYNRIERCWSALERHWNGSILSSIETTLKWARSMTWCAIHPIVRVLDGIYSRSGCWRKWRRVVNPQMAGGTIARSDWISTSAASHCYLPTLRHLWVCWYVFMYPLIASKRRVFASRPS